MMNLVVEVFVFCSIGDQKKESYSCDFLCLASSMQNTLLQPLVLDYSSTDSGVQCELELGSWNSEYSCATFVLYQTMHCICIPLHLYTVADTNQTSLKCILPVEKKYSVF